MIDIITLIQTPWITDSVKRGDNTPNDLSLLLAFVSELGGDLVFSYGLLG